MRDGGVEGVELDLANSASENQIHPGDDKVFKEERGSEVKKNSELAGTLKNKIRAVRLSQDQMSSIPRHLPLKSSYYLRALVFS